MVRNDLKLFSGEEPPYPLPLEESVAPIEIAPAAFTHDYDVRPDRTDNESVLLKLFDVTAQARSICFRKVRWNFSEVDVVLCGEAPDGDRFTGKLL